MNTISQTYGNDWRADILCRINDDGWSHATLKVDGETAQSASDGLRYMFDLITKGRETAVRAWSVNSDLDFDTKIIIHRGYARFSFRLSPGEHTTMLVDDMDILWTPNAQ